MPTPTTHPTSEAERRLDELFDSAPDGILEVDSEGRIVLLNRTAAELFGYTREELMGQTVEVLVPQVLRGAHRQHRTQYSKQPATRPMGTGLRLEGRRKDRSTFPVEISLSPTKSEGGLGVTAIIRDITERLNMEDRLRAMEEKYVRALESRNRESEEANRLKTEFLRNVSHELRSPLQTVIGFAELLTEENAGPLTEKQKCFVGHIQADARHVLDLVNDLLDLSKIEAGRFELQLETFHIGPVIDEACSSIRPRATAKSLDIQTEVSIPGAVLADRLRFKQILYNLLSNAVKFTPVGGKVRVEAAPRNRFAEISISDTGTGIPEDKHQAVFDKFYQLRPATGGRSEGTGLGLAITKRLIEEHGGTIWLKSKPGGGSCFTFTLPLVQFQAASVGVG